jgi:hypothetical protein
MALPLQELISPPQEDNPTAQETSLPHDEISLPHREETSLSKEEASPPEEETLSRQHRAPIHAPIVRVAAKALVEKNIPIVEYGEQIQWRYGDPVVLLVSIKAFVVLTSRLVGHF